MNIKEINQALDPLNILLLIGYNKSRPTYRNDELRDFCPIHQGDHQQSLAINTVNHTFFCHSCGAKGDLIELYRQARNITFAQALEDLTIHVHINTHKEAPMQRSYIAEDVIRCWQNAQPSGNDSYFAAKKLSPPPIARFGKNPYGYDSILIPLKNVEGDLTGIISLSASGKYNFKINDTIKGSFALLGDLQPEGYFYIGEGIATVQTAWEATQRTLPAVAAGTWSNIELVVSAITTKYPQAIPLVLIDSDEKGLEAARAVAEKFPAAEFRRPSFEGLPNPSNQELTDFNDLISKCNQLLSVVAEQLKKEVVLTQAPLSLNIQFINEHDKNFLLEDAPEMPRLVNRLDEHEDIRPFIRKGIVGQVVGAGGIGKTHWLTQLALSIATGAPFLDQYPIEKPGAVFLGLGENAEDDIHRLLRKMARRLFSVHELEEASNRLAVMSLAGKQASFVHQGTPTTFYNDFMAALQAREPQEGWSCIILDPISRFLGTDAETDNAAATQFIALLERFTLELKGRPTVLFGHHMSKAGLGTTSTDQTAARGSSAITDGVRWQANLERVEKKESDDDADEDESKYEQHVIKLRVVKSNFAAIPPVHLLEKDEYGCLSTHIPVEKSAPEIIHYQPAKRKRNTEEIYRKLLNQHKQSSL